MHIGWFGHIAPMRNPKSRSGPTASKSYPIIRGEPGRKALSDYEKKEASIMTHTMWMANPPGEKTATFSI